MNMTVQVPCGVAHFKRKSNLGPVVAYERTRPVTTRVLRVARLPSSTGKSVLVDAFISERDREHIAPDDKRWIAPDVFRTVAHEYLNRRTVRSFLESGEDEWNFQEVS
ncbi:hypothetical protein [Burkholderia stagnalis]|uniref:Uncharacterized protein n=1 Tax=Burkholderia stagnalis TaxID=1503054 RepID=A0A107AM79_9BURK|nr:hypothetical protein [Burkholderia stagnalis]KVZ05922.1 hypothetical protein WT35_24335 [Burkholderia stagnalis]KWA50576.1 hypothetical protein WT43_29200 [Burkholderia stagnalis]KWA61706.1 hypothetical protein WT42_03015 [Burkholderia stagnalis]KWA66087.1 hypothetical protein WT44_07600 [Burkholderia stagnalis]KWD04200.1 hypothetical protein WT46_14155 [Burkholderia stagnalis]